MTNLKRKASQELTRDSVTKPIAAVYEEFKMVPVGESWIKRACDWGWNCIQGALFKDAAKNYETDHNEQPAPPKVVGAFPDDTHVLPDNVAKQQTITPMNDQTSNRKRSKSRPKQNISRPRLPIEKHRRNELAIIDFDGRTAEEARNLVDSRWEPPPLKCGSRRSVAEQRKASQPSSEAEEDHTQYASTHRHSGRADSPVSIQSDSSSPETALRMSITGFKLESSVEKAPRTPESLPQEDFRTSRNGDTKDMKGLQEDIEKLLLAGDEGDGKHGALLSSNRKNLERKKERVLRIEREREQAVKAARERRLHRRRPLRDIVQPLSDEWDMKVADAVSRDAGRVISKSQPGTELRVKDFATLLGRHAWLNDEIINAYIEWIVYAANEAAVADSKAGGNTPSTVPKFIAHNSFFWENLKNKGAVSTERLMKRKKAPGVSLMEVDSVFVPICSGAHWTIGVVRPVAKTIEYFDSMGNRPPAFFKLMRDWLQFQLKDQYNAEEWSEPRTACAHQTNGYDCGVFVCTNAFCVAVGFDTSCYHEDDMTQQRRNIAAVLINKGFVGEFAWNHTITFS